jgi:hypothetical protein
MGDPEEKPKLRGPLAPLRLFLSSGKAVGRASKSLAGRGLQKVKRRGRPGPLASVSAAHFARPAPEEAKEEYWCVRCASPGRSHSLLLSSHLRTPTAWSSLL